MKSKSKVKKEPKSPVILALHDLETIRLKWCSGLQTEPSIAREFGVSVKRLRALAKKLKWVKVVLLDGTLPYGQKELVIRGVRVAYVGPLTPEERQLVSAVKADLLADTIAPHRHAAATMIFLVNQYLEKLVANNGMEERIVMPKKMGEEPVKLLVPGHEQLLALAKILGYAVPIDRQAMGLDDKPGTAGEKQAEEREKQAKATAAALMNEFADQWEKKIALLPKRAMITNGHATGTDSPRLVRSAADGSG